MFDWLSRGLGLRKAPTHPLGSAESRREIIADLPTGNPPRALQDLADWMALTDRAELPPAERIAAIRALDGEGQRFTREVMLDFLAEVPTHHRAEQTWFLLSTWQGRVFDACSSALRDLFDAGGSMERDKGTAALLAASALAALAERKKLLRMRYRMVEPTVWGDLYGIFQLADQLGVARRPVRLSGASADTSVQRELLCAVWFDLGPIGNIDHLQMEYLDRIVRELLSFLAFRDAPDAETRYVLDFAQTLPPQRWHVEQTALGSQRFLGPGQVYAQLVALSRDVRRTQSLPTYLHVEKVEGVQHALNLIDRLVLHWSRTPPRRVHDRVELQERLEVVHGYREIRRMIAGIAYLRLTEAAAGRDLSRQQRDEFSRYGFVSDRRDPEQEAADEIARVRAMIETQNQQLTLEWVLTDASECGIGAIAQGATQWMQVGLLLGLRRAGETDWSCGVVRRMSRNARGQATVGVQRFAGIGRCGRIGSLDNRQVSVFERSLDPGVSVYFDAIALLEDNAVLVEPGVYAEHARFRLVIEGQRTTIRFLQLLERGLNFEHVRFEVEADGPG